jgi:predicted small metal-binding protein
MNKLITIPDSLFKKIKESAKKNHRTTMEEIRQVLINHFKR